MGPELCGLISALNFPPGLRSTARISLATVTLYMVDCKPGPGGRDQNIDTFDWETLNRIAPTVRINDMEGGVYATFTYNRSIRFRCNNIRGDNAVINAVFFEPAP